jgi:acetyl esterase/lipase
MYIPACEKDPTYQETLFFYEECKKQGVDAEFKVWKGLPHFFWGIPQLKKSQEFMEVWCQKLDEMLASP